MSQHSTTNTTNASSATLEELSVKFSTGSIKKQKNKDSDEPLTDDFVLMSTPEKFKDKNTNETNAVKRNRSDSSPNAKIDLDCLLLSDSSEQSGIPQHVWTLLQHFESVQLSQAEILFLLVYVVALETGFVCRNVYELVNISLVPLPATCSFNARNIQRLTRSKPQYHANEDRTRFSLKLRSLIDTGASECSGDFLYALLTGFVTGDFLIVSLTPAYGTVKKGFSTTLSIGRYVLSMKAKNKPLYMRFRKLDELSYVLRDQLLVPMRCQQFNWCECCIYPSLDGLPAELYDHILKYLKKNDLAMLVNVNKSLYNIIKSSKFMPQTKTSLSNILV